MDTNNDQSSSGDFHERPKKKARRTKQSLLTAELSGIKKSSETDGSQTTSHVSFSDTFSPEEYNAKRLFNVQYYVEPEDEEFARMYRKAVPIYPQNTTGRYDIQEKHSDHTIGTYDVQATRSDDTTGRYDVQETRSDVPRNAPDSEVRPRPGEEKKRGRRKWFWAFIGISIAISASIIAYSYAAGGGEHESLPTGDDTDPKV